MSENGTTPYPPDAGDHLELAVAWVLRALDDDQERAFLAHLEDEACAECAAVVAETADTLAAVGAAVPQEEPPADLGYRLLATVEAERAVDDEPASGDVPFTGSARGPRREGARRAPLRSAGVSGSAVEPGERSGNGRATGDGSPAPAHEGATVRPLRRRPVVRRALTAVAAAAAVVVIGGLVVSNDSLRDERDERAATAQAYDRIVDVMRDAGQPGAVSAPLAEPGGALVGLVVDQGAGPEILSTRLGPNRADQTYVLWSIAPAPGSAPAPLGTFDVPDENASVRSVPSGPAAGPVSMYAVSLEPGRTAPAAPTRIVASGQVGR